MKTHRAQNTDTGAIKQLAAAWRSGWLSGDADALVALYADKPVLMPQGHAAIVGKKAIRKLYRAVFREVTITSTGRLMEVGVSGNLGYFWSTYSLKATPKRGGASTRSRGKSVFIVKRQRDGTWKIARLIDNADTTDESRKQGRQQVARAKPAAVTARAKNG